MAQEHFYEVSIQWTSDRKGIISSPVLNHEIEVATPPEFPKGIAGIWSPEHLFVAAVNTCFMTTFLAVAENSKLEFQTFHSKAIGKLEIIEGKYMISEITLMPEVKLTNISDTEKAERIMHKSEAACLISNSIKTNINFQPIVQ